MSKVVCPGCKRSLDDVTESLIRQRGKFKGQREQARMARDRLIRAIVEHRTAITNTNAGSMEVQPGYEAVAEAKARADDRLWKAVDDA